MLTMFTVAVGEVLRKLLPEVIESNPAVGSDKLMSMFSKTLIYQPLPVTAKGILLELKVCQLAEVAYLRLSTLE